VPASGEPQDGRSLDEDIVHSLARGLAVIGALGRPGPGRTAADVAGELRLGRAATYRILDTLCNLGYVRPRAGRFALTPRTLELGYRQWSGLDLADLARLHLERLRDETAEACSLSILHDDAIVCVARATPARLICAAEEVGTRLPAYATSQGRVLLCALSAENLRAHLARVPLRPLTPATVARREDLHRELARVQRRGWALVDQELELGLRSIAVPIVEGQHVVAAVGIVADSQRVSVAELRGTLPLLRVAADGISGELAASRGRPPGG
jgi:IclR family transcriptional regulator, pca regulon regulatory protein